MVADVVDDGLRVLFCGINPGLLSARTGHHFARPGNRFWPVLHASGFTPRQLRPDEQGELPRYGVGITNVVARPTAQASELSRAELVEGGARLVDLVARRRPRWLAVAGIGAWRTAFGARDATVGLQRSGILDAAGTADTADTGAWVLPNPSGLNARWTREALTTEYGRLRAAAFDG